MGISPSSRESWTPSVLCFLIAIPSGASLLAHIYGVLPMVLGGAVIALVCCLSLVGITFWARSSGRPGLADALTVGLLAGLVGTLLYDLARIPVLLTGRLVFAPIELYGVWLWDASSSTRFTELSGWIYHFSNGITFGILYALFFRGRHWLWGVGWAMVLESIFLITPLAHSAALFADYKAIVVAYYGHVAYGWGLGWLVQHWDYSRSQWSLLRSVHKWGLLAAIAGFCVFYTVEPGRVARDASIEPGALHTGEGSLIPDWTRIRTTASGSVRIQNTQPAKVTVRLPRLLPDVIALEPGETRQVVLPALNSRFDIYQFKFQGPLSSRTSFVIVEK